MTGFARCCCLGCECVLESELPTITINGMTGLGWTGSLCCFRQVFQYNQTPADTIITTDPIYSSTATQDRTQEVLTGENFRVPMYDSPAPVDFCDDIDYDAACCSERNILMGTLREIVSETIQRKLRVTYRPVSVEVEFSKQEVDCSGSIVCRYVIKLSVFYSYDYVYLTERQSSRQVISTPAGGCFLTVGPDSNGKEASFTDESEGTITSGGGSGSFQVDRIKYYETAPNGTITFVTSDTDTCDRTEFVLPVCDTTGNYISQVCINAESASPPCWCGAVTVDFIDDTYSDPSGEDCTPYALTYTCGDGPCFAAADFCPAGDVPCEHEVQCSGVVVSGECEDAIFLLTGLDSAWQIGDDPISFFPDCCITQGELICSSYPFAVRTNCEDVPLGSGLECDEDCCHSYIDFEESCPNCSLQIISCVAKYTKIDRTITAHTLATSCTGPTARSACITTPSSFQIVLS